MATNIRRTASDSFARIRDAAAALTQKPLDTETLPTPSNDTAPITTPTPAPVVVKERPSLIAKNVTMTGSIASPDELEIHGTVEGDARAHMITIGAGAVIKGDAIADILMVAGTVEGRIIGGKVQLLAGALVRGDIVHDGLAIEAGAMFEGIARRPTTAA